MRQAYAHDAVLVLPSGADERAPGAAVTVALCGHWGQGPPPAGLTADWQLSGSEPSEVTGAEEDHASRLVRS